MAAAMALMESPAIILAIVLANKARAYQSKNSNTAHEATSISTILHESFTDGAQLLLLGSMLVGLVSGDAGQKLMAPFSIDLFCLTAPSMLCNAWSQYPSNSPNCNYHWPPPHPPAFRLSS